MSTPSFEKKFKVSVGINSILAAGLLTVSWLFYTEKSKISLVQPFSYKVEEDRIKQSATPDSVAKRFIKNYASEVSDSTIKSIWLNNSLMYYIFKNYDSLNINGLRIYLAKYSAFGQIDASSARIGKTTMIAVPTHDLHGNTVAIAGAFFNYGSLCPEVCPIDSIR